MREEYAKRMYNGICLSMFLNLRMKNDTLMADEYLEKIEKEWPKYRGDMKQVARLKLEGKL